MTSEQSETLESDASIEDNSIENDFHFSHLTPDTDLDDDFYRALPQTRQESNSEYIEFEEDVSLEFYETIPLPTLQELAAFVVAIESWRQILSKDTNIVIRWCDYFSKDNIDDEYFLRHLPLPGSIRELVLNCLKSIKTEIHFSTNYYNWGIITSVDEHRELSISYFRNCVWTSDGKIDLKKSALNMLSNAKLNILHRFRVMCAFCLEDELKKLSPDEIPERFRRRITLDRTPSQYYWLHYLNNDLDKLPKMNSQSIEAVVISTNELNTWSAVEYFWDRLNINEQISAALVLLESPVRTMNIQKHLFSKMNKFQKYHILSTIPFHIIINFYYEKLYELALLTVIRFGKKLTYGNFTDLIRELLLYSLPRNVEALSYLGKIWNYFPDDFKNLALQSMAELIICHHTEYYWPQDGDPEKFDPTFLLTFLSSASVDFRRNLMLRNEKGTSIAVSCDPSMIDRVIQLCLPTANDLALFEKNILSDNYAINRYVYGLDKNYNEMEELADFIHRSFTNSNNKIEFIERMLPVRLGPDIMERWNGAIILIDKYFDMYSPHQVMKFKRRIVWAFVNYHAQCKCDYKYMHEFIQVIHQVLEGDVLERYKKVALKRFYRQFSWVIFDRIRVHQFLLWCLNYDYVEMRRFVKSISIDDIFKQVWDKLKWDWFGDERSQQAVSEKFALIDKVLLWYFGKSDRVKEYKLEKIFGFRNGTEMFVKNDGSFDEIFCRNVLPWFFEGDREGIRKFKELYENDRIVELIDID